MVLLQQIKYRHGTLVFDVGIASDYGMLVERDASDPPMTRRIARRLGHGRGLCLGCQPDRQRQRMSLQPFRFSETDRRWTERGEASLIATEQRGTLDEIQHAKTGGKARASARRQDMVGSTEIVPDGLGGVAAEEYGAGVLNLLGQRIGFVEREFEMLRSDPVDEHRRLVPVGDEEDRTVGFPARASDACAR